MKLFRIFFVLCVSLSIFITFTSHASSIGEIEMHFCDTATGADTKTILLQWEARQPLPICISFKNNADTPTSISVNFVDGTITNDGSKKKACLEEWTKKVFWQYVTWIQTDKLYSIDKRSTLTLTGSLVFPDGYVGEVIGCLTYAIADQASGSWAISVFVRKANIIMVSLSGEIRRVIDFIPPSGSYYDDNLSDDPQLVIYRNPEWKYVLGFSLINSGNISESVTLHGHISNTRWWSQDIDITSKEIAPWIQSDYSDILELPRYSTQYTMTLSGQSTPVFLLPDSQYHVSNTGAMIIWLTTSFTTPWSFSRWMIDSRYVLLWWCIVAILIISILALIIIIRKRRRVTAKVVSKRKTTLSWTTTKKEPRTAMKTKTIAKKPIKKKAATKTEKK